MKDMAIVIALGGIITVVIAAVLAIIKVEIDYREECKKINEFFEHELKKDR